MKNACILMIFILLVSCTSCAHSGEAYQSSSISDSPTQSSEDSQSISQEVPEISINITDQDFSPVSEKGGSPQELPSIDLNALPKAAPLEEKNSVTNGIFYIAALNLNLPIPEGYTLTHIQGQYKDQKGENVVLPFVDEYVLTMKSVTQEELTEDIQLYSERRHYSDDYLKHSPGYVLFSFRIFQAACLPIECLYRSSLPSNNEYRTQGNIILSLGESTWEYAVKGGKAFYYQHYDPEGIDPSFDENKTSPDSFYAIDSNEWPVEELLRYLRNATEGNGLLYGDMEAYYAQQFGVYAVGIGPLFRRGSSASMIAFESEFFSPWSETVANIDTSFPDDSWQENYLNALALLDQETNKYIYPQIRLSFERKDTISLPEKYRSYVEDLQSGWYTDSEADHKLRAFVFANLKEKDSAVQLEDIIILLKNAEQNKRLFLAVARKNTEYSVTDFGEDFLEFFDPDYLKLFVWN